jgi:hypothetical protein
MTVPHGSDQGSWETGSPILRLGDSAIPSKQGEADDSKVVIG